MDPACRAFRDRGSIFLAGLMVGTFHFWAVLAADVARTEHHRGELVLALPWPIAAAFFWQLGFVPCIRVAPDEVTVVNAWRTWRLRPEQIARVSGGELFMIITHNGREIMAAAMQSHRLPEGTPGVRRRAQARATDAIDMVRQERSGSDDDPPVRSRTPLARPALVILAVELAAIGVLAIVGF